MYENGINNDLKQKIIAIVNQSRESNAEILKILMNDLKEVKLHEDAVIYYCSCGYPIGYIKYGGNEWIAEILKQEVDFRSYREFYYCPKCNSLLDEFQH